MDAIKCIKERRSIRVYQDKAIKKEIIEDIIDCARLAPTARNEQPWEFIAVTDKEKLAALGKASMYGPFIKDAACCIVVCGDASNKHLIEDGCAATENILLAAYSYGIGSCWVAGWKRVYNDEVKNILEIPKNLDIVSIIPLGYIKDKVKAPPKRELKDVLHWEKF